MNQRAKTTERGYGGAWQKARKGYLANHPLCVMCEKHGRVTAATVVDHIVPHKQDWAKFWDHDNWQALCSPCHDRHKKIQENTGRQMGCDADGLPLDAEHPWA